MTKLITLLFIFLPQLVLAESSPQPPPSEMAALERGEVIVKSVSQKGEGSRFNAWAIFHTPIEKIKDVLVDFNSYPKFMPDITHIELISHSPDVVNYTLGLPLGIEKRYRLSHSIDIEKKEVRLRWKQVPWKEVLLKDSIRHTEGMWHLSELEKNKTLVFYDVYTDPGGVPFGLGWIVDYLSKESVPNVLLNTKAYVTDSSFRK